LEQVTHKLIQFGAGDPMTLDSALKKVFQGVASRQGERLTLQEKEWVACNGAAAFPFRELQREGTGADGGVIWEGFRNSFTCAAFPGLTEAVAKTLLMHRLEALSGALEEGRSRNEEPRDGYSKAAEAVLKTSIEQGWLWLGKLGHRGKVEWREGHGGLWLDPPFDAHLVLGQDHLNLGPMALAYDSSNPRQVTM
jgi:hypothetical protein